MSALRDPQRSCAPCGPSSGSRTPVFAGFVFTVNDHWRPFSASMWQRLGRATAAFFLFSFLASSVYLLNDVLDVEKDRKHPTKRRRPIASGDAVDRAWRSLAALVIMPLALLGATC